jgi:hypothetical protein
MSGFRGQAANQYGGSGIMPQQGAQATTAYNGASMGMGNVIGTADRGTPYVAPEENINWDMYMSKQVVASHVQATTKFLLEKIYGDPRWYTQEALPWIEWKAEWGNAYAWDEHIFNRTLMDAEPETGVARNVTSRAQSNSASFIRYGLAMQMSDEMLRTDAGRTHWINQMQQLKNALLETVFFGVVDAYWRAHDTNTARNERLGAAVTTDARAAQWKRERDGWNAVPKPEGVFENLINDWMQYAREEASFMPNYLVIVRGAARYTQMRKYDRAYLVDGNRAPATGTTARTLSQFVPVWDNVDLIVREPDSFKPGTGTDAVDLMQRIVTRGNYVTILDRGARTSLRGAVYPAEEAMSIETQNGATDRIQRIGPAQWIKALPEFHADGTLDVELLQEYADYMNGPIGNGGGGGASTYNPNGDNESGARYANIGSYWYYDADAGEYRVAETLGARAPENLPLDAIRDYARSVHDATGMHAGALEAVRGALNLGAALNNPSANDAAAFMRANPLRAGERFPALVKGTPHFCGSYAGLKHVASHTSATDPVLQKHVAKAQDAIDALDTFAGTLARTFPTSPYASARAANAWSDEADASPVANIVDSLLLRAATNVWVVDAAAGNGGQSAAGGGDTLSVAELKTLGAQLLTSHNTAKKTAASATKNLAAGYGALVRTSANAAADGANARAVLAHVDALRATDAVSHAAAVDALAGKMASLSADPHASAYMAQLARAAPGFGDTAAFAAGLDGIAYTAADTPAQQQQQSSSSSSVAARSTSMVAGHAFVRAFLGAPHGHASADVIALGDPRSTTNHAPLSARARDDRAHAAGVFGAHAISAGQRGGLTYDTVDNTRQYGFGGATANDGAFVRMPEIDALSKAERATVRAALTEPLNANTLVSQLRQGIRVGLVFGGALIVAPAITDLMGNAILTRYGTETGFTVLYSANMQEQSEAMQKTTILHLTARTKSVVTKLSNVIILANIQRMRHRSGLSHTFARNRSQFEAYGVHERIVMALSPAESDDTLPNNLDIMGTYDPNNVYDSANSQHFVNAGFYQSVFGYTHAPTNVTGMNQVFANGGIQNARGYVTLCSRTMQWNPHVHGDGTVYFNKVVVGTCHDTPYIYAGSMGVSQAGGTKRLRDQTHGAPRSVIVS